MALTEPFNGNLIGTPEEKKIGVRRGQWDTTGVHGRKASRKRVKG